jgi:hypothetical protein
LGLVQPDRHLKFVFDDLQQPRNDIREVAVKVLSQESMECQRSPVTLNQRFRRETPGRVCLLDPVREPLNEVPDVPAVLLDISKVKV